MVSVTCGRTTHHFFFFSPALELRLWGNSEWVQMPEGEFDRALILFLYDCMMLGLVAHIPNCTEGWVRARAHPGRCRRPCPCPSRRKVRLEASAV